MFKSLLPANATDLERALEQTMAGAYDHPVMIDKLWSADDCPLELLPFLAWAVSVDTWNPDWPEHVKRQVVATSAYVHKYKGTAAGLKAALNALDLGVQISEWFEHGGERYSFKAEVDIGARGITGRDLSDIFSVIKSSKNARSYLKSLRLYLTAPFNRPHATVLSIGQTITIGAYTPELPDQVMLRSSAMAVHSIQTITIGAAYD